ncbi:hypothetical protein RB597_002179 [Gaeumannomyces tritici]
MEGILAVPPDRGTIIGRALWKTRFVVVGPQKREQSGATSTWRILTPRDSPGNPATTYLSIYKSRSELEPTLQYHIGSVTECQVQMIAHRKQGPVLPTLVVTFAPDPATDKLRKRRSSRAAGLTSSSKDTPLNTLWFRTGAEDGTSLQDWARCIQLHMQRPLPQPQYAHGSIPMSPVTPASPTFANPFASSRPRDQSDLYTRPPSGNVPSSSSRGTLQHKGSTQASRDRPITYSGSPSLRSKRSDISSHASVMNHMQQAAYATHYGSMHTADLPSPATTIGDYQGDFIEGWTTAQGRSSALSSPIRGRESVGSAVSPLSAGLNATLESSSPPIPRETILDRAFQLRCIPGSEAETPGEEKLTSLARFEALMKGMDRKRSQRESGTSQATAQTPTDLGLRGAWDSDEDSDSDDDVNDYEDPEPNHRLAASGYGHRHGSLNSPRHGGRSHSYSQSQSGFAHEEDIAEEDVSMPAGAQRALEFITTGRSSPALSAMRSAASPRSPRSPTGEFPQYSNPASNLLPPMNNSGSSQLRPDLGPSKESWIAQQTAYNRPLQVAASGDTLRSSPAQQSAAGSHVANTVAPPPRMRTAPPAASGKPQPEQHEPMSSQLSLASRRPAVVEKRLSGQSLKRLSITELTKRLSASSLCMVQTNASSSSDGDSQKQQQQTQSSSLRGRGGMVPPPGPADRDRCGWRGKFGVDGGFL